MAEAVLERGTPNCRRRLLSTSLRWNRVAIEIFMNRSPVKVTPFG